MKHNKAVIEHLRQIKFFSACQPAELEQVARVATEIHFPAGDVLAAEGRIGRELIVIISGRARVSIGGKDIAMLSDGECFGEISLLDDGPRTATVTAETDVAAEVISQREFSTLLSTSPGVARSLLVGLARRLRAADVELVGAKATV